MVSISHLVREEASLERNVEGEKKDNQNHQ